MNDTVIIKKSKTVVLFQYIFFCILRLHIQIKIYIYTNYLYLGSCNKDPKAPHHRGHSLLKCVEVTMGTRDPDQFLDTIKTRYNNGDTFGHLHSYICIFSVYFILKYTKPITV